MTNTGPLPPKAGQQTTYTVVWSLINSTNDLGDVKVSATLPAYLRWTGATVPADPTLVFDSTTRKVSWTPGVISAGTGYTSRTREVAFQVGLTPTFSQVSQTPEIISEANLEAKDLFTNVDVTQNARSLTTAISDDPEVHGDIGRVVE